MRNKRLYLSLKEFLVEKFREKVKKIPLDAGLSCPNRDGTKGVGGCLYCDAKGSGTGLATHFSLSKQLKYFIEKFRCQGYNKFIAYFQSFSNTYAPKEKLEKIYGVIRDYPEIVGLAIGTRPDCLNLEIINLLKEFEKEGYHLWVELGLQSKHNETLKIINRGHSFEDFIEAYNILKNNTIETCIHLIFGLPGEDKEMMLDTVKTIAHLKPEGIKFHALYILEGSAIADLYHDGRVKELTLEEYAELVALSLSFLPPNTVIHRLTSDPPRTGLIAPGWLIDKNKVIQKIVNFMKEKELYQGKFYQ